MGTMSQNKSNTVQDTLRIQLNPTVQTEWKNVPEHEVVLEDKKAGFSIWKPSKP